MSKPIKGKRFVYKLESLLKVRKIREQQEKDKFTEAEKVLVDAIKKEESLKKKRLEAYVSLQEMMRTGTLPDMNIIKIRKVHLEKLDEQVEAQVNVRKEAEKKRDLQREKMIEAMKETKIIEKDREKTREAWRKMMDKEADKFLGEIAVIGHYRRSRKAEEEEHGG